MSEKVNVVIPTIGESVTEGIIGRWFHAEGEIVRKDEPLLEVDSDKASLEVPASATGRLTILVPEGTTAAVGTLVATIDTAAKGSPKASPKKETKKAEAPAASPAPTTAPFALRFRSQ